MKFNFNFLQVLQVSYFIYCTVFVDYADSGPGKSWIKPRLQQNKKIRDFIFISLVFPVTIVSIIYSIKHLKLNTYGVIEIY